MPGFLRVLNCVVRKPTVSVFAIVMLMSVFVGAASAEESSGSRYYVDLLPLYVVQDTGAHHSFEHYVEIDPELEGYYLSFTLPDGYKFKARSSWQDSPGSMTGPQIIGSCPHLESDFGNVRNVNPFKIKSWDSSETFNVDNVLPSNFCDKDFIYEELSRPPGSGGERLPISSIRQRKVNGRDAYYIIFEYPYGRRQAIIGFREIILQGPCDNCCFMWYFQNPLTYSPDTQDCSWYVNGQLMEEEFKQLVDHIFSSIEINWLPPAEEEPIEPSSTTEGELTKPEIHSPYLEGDVKVVRNGEERPLEINEALLPGDAIVTGEDGKVELSWSDGTVVKIGENTKIEVVELKETESVLKIWWGKLHTTIKKLKRKGKFEIHVPPSGGRVSVRGTEFTLEVAEDGTTILTVLDGAAELSDLAKTKTVVVEQHQTSIVEPGGVPSDPVSIDPDQIDEWWGWEEEVPTPSPKEGICGPTAVLLIAMLPVAIYSLRRRR